ncbi:MAG: copper homeostasis protein CutC [Flavobacteriales bacterium]|nr:copper homeostasis protein CutC [Flavobacteriales bacterium]MBP9080942.1 copper homeostasis protein CutC [Flavobacteriales bacterium]
MPLEVCCYSLSSCITAQRAGAHRVELCAGAEVGGTTPLRETIIAALDLGIPVVPMVRPRGGDFLYGTAELEEVRKAVRMCRELGCTAIVSGVQLRDGRLDAGAMKRIVDLAGPLEVACHKVFDGVPDAAEALETLVEAGCVRVLTSGMAADAMAGAHVLHGLVAQAGARIAVMPGGGVRSSNLEALARITGAREFHSSAITTANAGHEADETEVRALARELRAISG